MCPMNAHLGRSAVPTPALVVDLDALERNIATMAAFAAKAGKHLRPHVKTHKCVSIARLQIAAGAMGISCATLDELAALVTGGIPALLLTSPIAGDPKFAHLHELLQRDPDISVVVDDPQAVAILDALAKGLGLRLRVLVDFDVGQRRTGSPSVAAAVALAREVRSRVGLKFGGIQAYAGHIQHIPGDEERRVACEAVTARVRTLCAALTSEQLAPQIVTGAGTGTAEFDAAGQVYTELQPGSYVFMDAEYEVVGGLKSRYEPALFVDATVIAAQWEDRVTTDAGTKAFALNGPTPRSAREEAGWAYSYSGDEFGCVLLSPGARRPAWGERLSFVVSHCDPTVVLYPHYVCVRGEVVEAYWPIESRLYPML